MTRHLVEYTFLHPFAAPPAAAANNILVRTFRIGAVRGDQESNLTGVSAISLAEQESKRTPIECCRAQRKRERPYRRAF
jgi:hypothetical protein